MYQKRYQYCCQKMRLQILAQCRMLLSEMCCGKAGPFHQCHDLCEVEVGDGEAGYQNIVEAFRTKKIASQARAIIINPLHPALSKIPVLIHPTCNRFDAAFVERHWYDVAGLYISEMELGHLVANSSDGDSQHCSLMLTKALSQRDRHQPIPWEDRFIMTATREPTADGYILRNLMDQDYVHNHKKIINHLFHASRQLSVCSIFRYWHHAKLAIGSRLTRWVLK